MLLTGPLNAKLVKEKPLPWNKHNYAAVRVHYSIDRKLHETYDIFIFFSMSHFNELNKQDVIFYCVFAWTQFANPVTSDSP